jgi:hypothetical protein
MFQGGMGAKREQMTFGFYPNPCWYCLLPGSSSGPGPPVQITGRNQLPADWSLEFRFEVTICTRVYSPPRAGCFDVDEIVCTKKGPAIRRRENPQTVCAVDRPAIVEAIRRIHNGESVSALFERRSQKHRS